LTVDSAAIDVGLIAILHRIRAARLVAGLRRAIADLALTVLPRRRVGALETVRAGCAASTAIHVRFRRVQLTIGTGGKLADAGRARVELAIAVRAAAFTVGTFLCRRAGTTAVLARFLSISNAVRATRSLAFAALTDLAGAITGSAAG